MTDMLRGQGYRHKSGTAYRLTDKAPKHHGPQIADDLAALRCQGNSASARNAIRNMRETLVDLAVIARHNPIHREWLAKTLAPAIAACATPDPDECIVALAEAYANADCRTEPALVRWMAEPSEENWIRLRAALRQERARGAELEGAGDARMARA